MRRLFVDELNDLHVRFSEMGMMVNEAIYKSVKAFINHDKALAREVIHEDKHINEREVDLEKRSFELIALQQPVTTDLRVIVTVMKASSDLERMVEQVLDAYVKEDSARARKIALEDHGINDFSSRIYKECIRQMQENPETVVGSMDYMLVSSYLERIGDYVTNICEWIVYLKTGKITELNSNAIEDKF